MFLNTLPIPVWLAMIQFYWISQGCFKNLDVLADDIQNALLEDPTMEKIFFYEGDEWKADK